MNDLPVELLEYISRFLITQDQLQLIKINNFIYNALQLKINPIILQVKRERKHYQFTLFHHLLKQHHTPKRAWSLAVQISKYPNVIAPIQKVQTLSCCVVCHQHCLFLKHFFQYKRQQCKCVLCGAQRSYNYQFRFNQVQIPFRELAKLLD